MRVSAIVLCGLGLAALPACRSAQVVSKSSETPLLASGGTGPVEIDQTESADRPTEFKKLQIWLAVRGLTFTGSGVEIDETGALEVTSQRRLASAEDSVTRSSELLATNARVKAIGAARDAVLVDPTDASAYHALGRALRNKRKNAMALDALTTAARLAPRSAEILADLADVRNRVGDLDGSIQSYRRSAELDGSVADTHVRLAVLSYYAGDDASAWASVHDAERLGASVPPQFRVLLAERTPEG